MPIWFRRFNKFAVTSLSSAYLCALSSCGGGGGGGANSVAPVSFSSAPASFSISNFETVSVEFLASTGLVAGGATLATGTQIGSARQMQLLQLAKSKILTVTASSSSYGNLPTGAISQSMYCDNGTAGTISISSAGSGPSVSTGDLLKFTFNNCYDAVTNTILNGQFNAVFTAISGSLGTDYYSFSLSLNLNNLMSESSTVTIIGNGNITLVSDSAGPNTVNDLYTIATLTSTTSYGIITSSSRLSNFTINQQTQPNMPTSTYKVITSYSGDLASTSLDSRTVNVNTIAPFIQLSSDAYPYTGTVTITGSGSATVWVIPESSSRVLVGYDPIGKGAMTLSISKPWDSL